MDGIKMVKAVTKRGKIQPTNRSEENPVWMFKKQLAIVPTAQNVSCTC